MAPNPDVINLLRRMGLNLYEAKAYYALATTGLNTVGELSERAELPRPRGYDVLASLQSKGFVTVQPGRPVRYNAIPVAEAVETLKNQRTESLSKELVKIGELGTTLSRKISASPSLKKTGMGEVVWTLKGREAIYSRLASMIEGSNRHLVLSTTPEGLARKLLQHGKMIEKARNRGVKVNVISQLDREKAAEITRIARLKLTTLPTRFVLADEQALVFLTPDGTEPEEEVGIWVNSPHFVETMKRTAGD